MVRYMPWRANGALHPRSSVDAIPGFRIRDPRFGHKKEKGVWNGLDLDEQMALLVLERRGHEEREDLVEERPRPELACLVRNLQSEEYQLLTRKVDIRLPEKENSSSHDARPVHRIIRPVGCQ